MPLNRKESRMITLELILMIIIIDSSYGATSLDIDTNLRRYLQQHLTISKDEFERTKNDILPVVNQIIQKIKAKDSRFDMKLEYRGSVYEKVKIKQANEFDFDLRIQPLQLEQEQINEMEKGVPPEYTTYKLQPAVRQAWKNLADKEDNLLSPERVVATFSNLVKQSIDDINNDGNSGFKLSIKTNHPAVTISFKKKGKLITDVDFAPVIEVKKWPRKFAKRWEHHQNWKVGWPGKDVIDDLIKNTPVYLVPKLYKNKVYKRRHLFWRYAFNKAEKRLLLKSDPGRKNSCRRNVLRILKGFIEDLQLSGLRSYHMKTVLLHESEALPRPDDWSDGVLAERVLSAMERLRGFLQQRKAKCEHYFIPEVNIMEKINDQQRKELLKRVDEFLKYPTASILNFLRKDEVPKHKRAEL